MPYTYDQPYSLDGMAGSSIQVFDSANLTTPLTTFTADSNGRGKVTLTISDTAATTLYFVRASDSLRLAVVTMDPREITSLQLTNIATSVWGATTRSLTTFGTLAADVWASSTRTLTAFGFTVSTNANATETAIKAKTDNLPSSPAATTDIPSSSTIATAVWAATTRTLSAFGFTVSTTPNATETAIKAKTDLIPNAPASSSDIPTSSNNADAVWASSNRTLTSFGTLVDNIVSGVWGATTRTLSAFGFTVSTTPNSVENAINAKTTNLPPSPASEGNVTAVGNAVVASTNTITQQATDNANAILNSFEAVPTASENATAVWSAPTRTLTSGGGGGSGPSAEEIWAYPDRTLTSGGGSGGDFTDEEKEQLLTDTNYTANRLRATGSGDVNEPVLLTPVPGIPADMVVVFWNPSKFLIPTDATAKVGYVNNNEPLVEVTTSVELTTKKISPATPIDDEGNPIPNAMPYWILPKSSMVAGWSLYLDCSEANHNERRAESRFEIPDGDPPTQEGGVVGYLMSQLLAP